MKKEMKRFEPSQPSQPTNQATTKPAGSSISLSKKGVVAVVAAYNSSRMFVPGADNTFAGLSFPHVIIDSDCNGLLLSFGFNSIGPRYWAGSEHQRAGKARTDPSTHACVVHAIFLKQLGIELRNFLAAGIPKGLVDT